MLDPGAVVTAEPIPFMPAGTLTGTEIRRVLRSMPGRNRRIYLMVEIAPDNFQRKLIHKARALEWIAGFRGEPVYARVTPANDGPIVTLGRDGRTYA